MILSEHIPVSAPDSTPRLPELLAPAGSPEALEAALGAEDEAWLMKAAKKGGDR